MKLLKYLVLGIAFGIILIKSEAASWFRIFEMFYFESFHMYGIIGSAVILGMISIAIIKASKAKDYKGEFIEISPKNKALTGPLVGGVIFGLGWALAGACPGPMFALLGSGCFSIVLVIIGAIIGTYLYGLLRGKLPH